MDSGVELHDRTHGNERNRQVGLEWRIAKGVIHPGGRCPPDPLGFSAFRPSQAWFDSQRWGRDCFLIPSLVWPRSRCSGRSPALPYPPLRSAAVYTRRLGIVMTGEEPNHKPLDNRQRSHTCTAMDPQRPRRAWWRSLPPKVGIQQASKRYATLVRQSA